MTSLKRKATNESFVFHISTPSQPPTKRVRRIFRQLTDTEVAAERASFIAERQTREVAHREAAAKKAQDDCVQRLGNALQAIKGAGFSTLAEFMLELMNTNDQQHSAHISRTLGTHGRLLLESIQKRRPDIVDPWAVSLIAELLAGEGQKLAEFLHPASRQVSEILGKWSLSRIFQEAEHLAPVLCTLLRRISFDRHRSSERRDRDLILVTVICMLAQARNEQSNEFQTTMCVYLLACGASRSMFDVLQHAGITSSYTKALRTIKMMGEERAVEIVGIVKTRPFLLVWDNLNIAFRVAEQRKDSKDHFDNGTTATLIPLYDVSYGELSLDLLPRRTTRLRAMDFGPMDTLPSPSQVKEIEESQLWHICDILLDKFPALRKKFAKNISPPPSVLPIPVHKSEQYPLPAMHIDESSIDGALEVIDTIVTKSLKMTSDDIKKHGIIFCAGDQLTISLLDKASASRRDDSDLFDNLSQWTHGQLGLFHVKLAADRMVANEHWGTANSRSPWSLWRVNSLLGRKAISVGWKAKQLAPFRPTWELILMLTLPANILDAFRICSEADTLEKWVSDIKEYDEVVSMAQKVQHELCSAVRVTALRQKPRDVPLENIILFNRDALLLREFSFAIRCGDIGSVINVLQYWMVMFRGSGAMPKYADALFDVLLKLKLMDPTLRRAYLMNWLVNLSGMPNGFKELDLLQEHQNFWAKIIYCARGSNRSWDWLSMVSLSIFALRDVIRHVQTAYKTPHNGTSHTHPDTCKDIKDIRDYLEREQIQSYQPSRSGNDFATPVRDLMVQGIMYCSTARAFKSFRNDTRQARNLGVDVDNSSGSTSTDIGDADNDDTINDLGGPINIDQDDLALDEEEFPPGLEEEDLISLTQDIVKALSQFD